MLRHDTYFHICLPSSHLELWTLISGRKFSIRAVNEKTGRNSNLERRETFDNVWQTANIYTTSVIFHYVAPWRASTMSSTVNVGSAAQFRTLLSSSTIVITDCELPLWPRLTISYWTCFEFTQTGADLANRSVQSSNSSLKSTRSLNPLPLQRSTSTTNKRLLSNIALQRKFLTMISKATIFHTNISYFSMPTFLIFRSGSVIQTLRGADQRGLTAAVENAVKLAAAAKPTYSYSSTGHTLGGSSAKHSLGSLRWSFKAILHTIYTFIGLFFVSLFSVSR